MCNYLQTQLSNSRIVILHCVVGVGAVFSNFPTDRKFMSISENGSAVYSCSALHRSIIYICSESHLYWVQCVNPEAVKLYYTLLHVMFGYIPLFYVSCLISLETLNLSSFDAIKYSMVECLYYILFSFFFFIKT